MEYQKNDILKNITQIRKAKGFTQQYVAENIGMKQAGYGLIETGERNLQYDVLLQIAVVFDMDVVDIITYPEVYKKAKGSISVSPRVTLQIDIDQVDIKADVIKLAFGDRILEIKNK